MAERILVACFSASGVTKRVGEEIARAAGGDVKWRKGRQINRPNEAEIKKWLSSLELNVIRMDK